MKHIKQYESYATHKTVYYKIPSKTMEEFLVALSKVGMTKGEIEEWRYYRIWTKGLDFILLKHIYDLFKKEYDWRWEYYKPNASYKNEIIDIKVYDYDIDANKYNI